MLPWHGCSTPSTLRYVVTPCATANTAVLTPLCVQTTESESRLRKLADVTAEHAQCDSNLFKLKSELLGNLSTVQAQVREHAQASCAGPNVSLCCILVWLCAQSAKASAALEADMRDMKVKLYDLTAENVSAPSTNTHAAREPQSPCKRCFSCVDAQRRLTEENAKLAAQEVELLGYVSQLQEKCGLAE